MNDEFWSIALESFDDREPPVHCHHNINSDGADEPSVVVTQHQTLHGRDRLYMLQFDHWGPVTLKLAPLPLGDGICSALGSEAWYGSAILTAMLQFTNPKRRGRIFRHLQRCSNEKNKINARSGGITALELGSGAVGLSGIALGIALSQFPINGNNRKHQVMLSDNEPMVLKQLESNVASSVLNLKEQVVGSSPLLTEYTVHSLDWDRHRHSNENNNILTTDHTIDFAQGSELVYTKEGAHACFTMVRDLLATNDAILIVIVQVSDRDGWATDFLPMLRDLPEVNVDVEDPIVTDGEALHEAAGKLIRPGGTLNVLADFAVCYVSNC